MERDTWSGANGAPAGRREAARQRAVTNDSAREESGEYETLMRDSGASDKPPHGAEAPASDSTGQMRRRGHAAPPGRSER